MRRLLSLVLLLVFGLPAVAPALGISTDSESNLPACCRRNGAHHCAMSAEETDALRQGTHVTTVRSKCPCYPTPTTPLQHHDIAFRNSVPSLIELVSPPEPVGQIATCAKAAEAGARHLRGPPPQLL